MSKGSRAISFFSLPEFEQWKCSTEGAHTWKVKYYKGLGTSTGKEAKEYFSDMERHRIPFKYSGANDDDAILLVSVYHCCIQRGGGDTLGFPPSTLRPPEFKSG